MRRDHHEAFCGKTVPAGGHRSRRLPGGGMRWHRHQFDRQPTEPDRDHLRRAQCDSGPDRPAAGAQRDHVRPDRPVQRFRGARRLLRHQPDLAVGPARRPCPGRADRPGRALFSALMAIRSPMSAPQIWSSRSAIGDTWEPKRPEPSSATCSTAVTCDPTVSSTVLEPETNFTACETCACSGATIRREAKK
jgi:hypothetical protein